MTRSLMGVALLLSTGAALTAIHSAPQANGAIEGRVMRQDLSEGIPGVQMTLTNQGPIPTAAAVERLYSRSPALTPAMRDQIDAAIERLLEIESSEAVANAAAILQAQLLGLPLPATRIATPAAPPPINTATDSAGHFSFKNLAPGRYRIRAQREGYLPATSAGNTDVSLSTVNGPYITVNTGQRTPEVVLTMLKGGTVSGRIRYPTGQFAAGLRVTAYQLGYRDGRSVLLDYVNSRTTDDRGDYRLFWLPPGEYYIAVAPRTLGPTVGPEDAYAKTFFPGTIDAQSARSVTVAEGSDVAAVDIGIRAEATNVSGRVVNPFPGPDGQPVPVTALYLNSVGPKTDLKTSIDSATISFSNSAADRRDGRFEIRGVLPGIYDLSAAAFDNAELGRTAWGRTRIKVDSGGAQDIVIKIQPGIEVKARVTVDGAPPAPRAGISIGATAGLRSGRAGATPVIGPAPALVPTPVIQLTIRSLEPDNAPYEGAANQDPTYDPSGVYRFPNIPEGRYYLQAASLPANAYIADVQIGGMSVYDNGFDAGSVTGPIEVSVKTNGGKILGSVVDSAKKPFASARVALVPRQARRQNTSLYKTATSDAMGNFNFTAVAPGEYKLFAWEAVLNNAWMNAEFIAKYEDKGQSITVGSTNPAKIELKLIPR